jgi:hypothetical protein
MVRLLPHSTARIRLHLSCRQADNSLLSQHLTLIGVLHLHDTAFKQPSFGSTRLAHGKQQQVYGVFPSSLSIVIERLCTYILAFCTIYHEHF